MALRKFIKLKIRFVFIVIILLYGLACVNEHSKTSAIITAIDDTLNILYLGIDNPVEITASGIKTSELTTVIDNGVIINRNGDYIIIRPKHTGTAIISVRNNGIEILRKKLNVKLVPDPAVGIRIEKYPYCKTSGDISKNDLLKADGIIAVKDNLLFNVDFNIVSFVLTTTSLSSNIVRKEISNSDKFTVRQIDLINSLVKNQKLMIEDIAVVGSDGIKRKLNSMIFTINGE